MNYETTPKSSLSLSALLYALYGFLSFGLMLFNMIVTRIAYGVPFKYMEIGSYFRFDAVMICMAFIALGILLFVLQDDHLPAAIICGSVFVISFTNGFIAAIKYLINWIEYSQNFLDVTIDLIYICADTFSYLGFGVLALFCLMFLIYGKKNKKCGILRLWFAPAALYALGVCTEFLADIISMIAYGSHFAVIFGVLFAAGLGLMLAAAMAMHCLKMKKANEQIALTSTYYYSQV